MSSTTPMTMSEELQHLHKGIKSYQFPTLEDPGRALPSFPKILSNKLLWDHLVELGFYDRSMPIEKPGNTGFKTASNMSYDDIRSRNLQAHNDWKEYAMEAEELHVPSIEMQSNMSVFVRFFSDRGEGQLPSALNILPPDWEDIMLGKLANLRDGFEMFQIIVAILCRRSKTNSAPEYEVKSLEEGRKRMRARPLLFEFIMRLFLPTHGGGITTEMDTERNVGARIMPFFNMASNPGFHFHSNQAIKVPPILGLGSTVPHADLLTSVSLNPLMGMKVGIFVGEAKRPESKRSDNFNAQGSSSSATLPVPETKLPAKPDITKALNQTLLASLPMLSLIALASTNGKKVNRSRPPAILPHVFTFGLRYSASLIIVDIMFPAWKILRVGNAPRNQQTTGWSYHTVKLGSFDVTNIASGDQIYPSTYKFIELMVMILEHNERLFDELSKVSFHGIVGEALRVWRDDVKDEEEWLKQLPRLDVSYANILENDTIAKIKQDYKNRQEAKNTKKTEAKVKVAERKMAKLTVQEPLDEGLKQHKK